MRSEGYSSRSVCVSVCLSCLSTTILGLLQGHEKESGDFAETTAVERYGVKTSEKANMHNKHWLTSTAFSPFGAPWTN